MFLAHVKLSTEAKGSAFGKTEFAGCSKAGCPSCSHDRNHMSEVIPSNRFPFSTKLRPSSPRYRLSSCRIDCAMHTTRKEEHCVPNHVWHPTADSPRSSNHMRNAPFFQHRAVLKILCPTVYILRTPYLNVLSSVMSRLQNILCTGGALKQVTRDSSGSYRQTTRACLSQTAQSIQDTRLQLRRAKC